MDVLFDFAQVARADDRDEFVEHCSYCILRIMLV